MTPNLVTIVSFLMAAAIALSRVLVATRPAWSKLPASLQVALPLVVPALAVLAQGLAGVKTGVDLTTVVIGAVLLAVPGLPSNRSAAPLQAGKDATLTPSAGDFAVTEAIVAKASVAPPPPNYDSKTPPWGGPSSVAALLLAIAFAAHSTACGTSKPPCDQAKLAAVVLACTAQSQQCVNEGKSQAECDSLADCDAAIEKVCAK